MKKFLATCAILGALTIPAMAYESIIPDSSEMNLTEKNAYNCSAIFYTLSFAHVDHPEYEEASQAMRKMGQAFVGLGSQETNKRIGYTISNSYVISAVGATAEHYHIVWKSDPEAFMEITKDCIGWGSSIMETVQAGHPNTEYKGPYQMNDQKIINILVNMIPIAMENYENTPK